MNLRSPFSRTKLESPASTKTASPGVARNAVSFLLGGDPAGRRDGLRVAIGLTVLAALSLALLNAVVYQTTRDRYMEQKWRGLVAQTDERRDALRDAISRIEDEARYIAGGEDVRRWAAAGAAGDLSPAERERCSAELARAVDHFELDGAALVDSGGRSIASSAGTRQESNGPVRHLVTRTLRSGGPELALVGRGEERSPALTLALPVVPADGPRALLLLDVGVGDVIEPLLRNWPDYGPDAGAYLVVADGDRVLFLSAPPGDEAVLPGERRDASDENFRAASMAANGVESNVEVRDRHGEVRWAVTRFIPELGWGLVGQAGRRPLLAGMRGTLFGLLVLDVAMLVLSVAAFWFWRRQYLGGLARREIEVTRLHAAKVQAIFDNAFDAILTLDGSGRVQNANRAAEVLFGRSAAEMKDAPLTRFLHRAALDTTPVGAGSVVHSEVMRADGGTVPVEFSLGAAGEGDDLVHTVIVRDVSERVEAENRIRAFAEGLEVSNRRLEEANAQLEEASRLKSEFLANTSHELRTPLNGMIGFLQLVLDGLCDSEEEEREFQRQALQCSRHLLGLINDVLDIAKIEAGKLTLEVERIDVAALFDEVYTLAHVQAAQKGLKLVFEPPAERAVGVRGDFGKVKQVLINLVGNSLKFTHAGGITLRALPHVDLGYMMFEVTDTGVGIPADRQKVIFEKFTQGDGSTTRKYGGTGLGLAISRSLVELMGGIIGVHSDGPGKGTRMYFSLPVWRDVADDATPTEDEAALGIVGPAGGSLVMIVEDDPTFRLYLSALLHQHGYRTVEARNAEIGWMLARRLRPAVVVLDYALSSAEGAHLRTGWDLAERMTTEPRTRHIPIIFVTGFEGELSGKLRSNAFARKPHHLQKPVEGSALLAKIQEVVAAENGRVLRILMADDDPAVAAYVRKVLPEDRFILEVANDGEECLHLLRTQGAGYDLLLLDLMMPEVSGYDVLRQMTLSNLAPELPVLVLTNFPEGRSEEERRLLHSGLVVDVVPKVAVHDNPQLLPHVIDWHLQAAREQGFDEDDEATEGPEEKVA